MQKGIAAQRAALDYYKNQGSLSDLADNTYDLALDLEEYSSRLGPEYGEAPHREAIEQCEAALAAYEKLQDSAKVQVARIELSTLRVGKSP